MSKFIESVPAALALWLAALFSMPAAHAQASTNAMIRMAAEPDEFYLFDETDVKILDYKSAREVRLCVDKRQHAVPLEVSYDGKTAKVRVGDCFRFEAKEVIITPADDLEAGWDLSGTVETEQTG